MGIKIGDLNSEILEKVEKYFTNLQKWGSIFINDPTDEESILKIISEYKKIEENFVDFNENALKNLNKYDNMLLWGRRGTGKSTYLTKSFFHHIYNFKGKKKIVPIFIDCNLLFKKDLDEGILNISYFYAGLKSQIVKSLLLFQKILLHFKNQNLGSLDEEDIDSIQFEVIDLQNDNFRDELGRDNYDVFLENYSQQLFDNIEKNRPMNFDSIKNFLLDLKRRWKIKGFVFYIDEVSEFFIAKGYFKESVRNYFLEFLSECIPNLINLIVFKLVLYQESDFEHLQQGSPERVRIHRKYFSIFSGLDLFDENRYFGKRIGKKGVSIKRQYETDLNRHVAAIFSKASGDWQKIFEKYNNKNIKKQILKYIRESSGGTIRELGYIISGAVRQSKEDRNRTSQITIPNLRASIIAHYKRISSSLLIKERRVMEEIIGTKKKDGDPNVFYFTDNIDTESYRPLNENKVRNLFKQKFLVDLEQAFIINMVSMLKSNGETEYLFVYHPGFAFINTWSDEVIAFDSNHLRNPTMHIARNLRNKGLFFDYFSNYINEIEQEEQKSKEYFLDIITNSLLENGKSQTDIERFFLPMVKNQTIYQLKQTCEELGVSITPKEEVEEVEEFLDEGVKITSRKESIDDEWFESFLDSARKRLIRTQYLKDYLRILEIVHRNQNVTFKLIGMELNVSYPVRQRKYFLTFLKKKRLVKETKEGIYEISRKN